MKKIFVTILTAALISGGAYCQVTDSTQIRKDAEQAENQAEDSLERTQDDMKQKADETKMEEGAEKTGESPQNQMQKAGEDVQHDNGTATEGQKPAGEGMGTSEQSAAPSFGPMVEVIADKEGPNNEVIYKVNGELFYVDREQKQIVKAEESNLRDAKNAAVIHRSPMEK